MFQITKRAGAAPQQHCELQNEQELHDSNVANHKTSRSFTTATLRVSNKSNTKHMFVTFTIVPLVVSASQTYGLETFTICPEWNKSRSRTTATLQITKRAGLAPQQHCELQNEQELHHSNIVRFKTCESCTTATLWTTKRTRASPRQDCELQNEQELHHSNTTKHNACESCTTATLWIKKEQSGWTHYEFAQSGI